jgi:hypothetical protein
MKDRTAISSSAEPSSARIDGRADWLRLVLSLFLVFGLFHGSATILESDRGQRGILIGTLVVADRLRRRKRRQLLSQGFYTLPEFACLIEEHRFWIVHSQ